LYSIPKLNAGNFQYIET